jgi:hypothetical protein
MGVAESGVPGISNNPGFRKLEGGWPEVIDDFGARGNARLNEGGVFPSNLRAGGYFGTRGDECEEASED